MSQAFAICAQSASKGTSHSTTLSNENPDVLFLKHAVWQDLLKEGRSKCSEQLLLSRVHTRGSTRREFMGWSKGCVYAGVPEHQSRFKF